MGEFCLYSHDSGKNLVLETAKSMKCRTNEDPPQAWMEADEVNENVLGFSRTKCILDCTKILHINGLLTLLACLASICLFIKRVKDDFKHYSSYIYCRKKGTSSKFIVSIANYIFLYRGTN